MTLLEEIQLKVPASLVAAKEHGLIAAAVSVDRKQVKEYWLTDRGLVADLVTISGDTTLSNSILAKLDALANQDRSTAAIVSRLVNDPRGVNFGDTALLAQFQLLKVAGVLTQQELDALSSLALQDAPVSVAEVIEAMKGL